jgi:hypothetical protein
MTLINLEKQYCTSYLCTLLEYDVQSFFAVYDVLFKLTSAGWLAARVVMALMGSVLQGGSDALFMFIILGLTSGVMFPCFCSLHGVS